MWKTGRFVLVVVILSVVCISEVPTLAGTTAQPLTTQGPGTVATATPRLTVGVSCAASNHDSCASGLTCDSTDTCRLTSGGDCSSSNFNNCADGLMCRSTRCTPVPLHLPCNQTHSYCYNVNTTCQDDRCECINTHYAHDDTTCLLRKKVHETCTYRTPDNNECTRGAECTAAYYCACVPDYFYEEINKTCSPRKGENVACMGTKECIPNAECVNMITSTAIPTTLAPVGKCQCEQDYYHDTTGFNKCLPKLAPGVSCAANDQCVDGATCEHQSNVCQCNSSTYEFNHTCQVHQVLHGNCDETIPYQCLANGVCLRGSCQCDDHSFVEGQLCTPTIAVGNTCDYFNHEERQCESDTKCVFRYWDDGPVCGCDIDHFFNGHVCQPRALAGDPCPYDPNYPHDSLRLKIDHQCVDNAECSPRLICECNESTHYQRGQHCPPRIEEYGTCDPWANYYNQCIDHHDCVHGRCVPS